jgi:HTH-type transcriptional regulator/antitoxin HigA
MPSASPQAVLERLMEAKEIRQADLVGILGSKGVVSEVVNGKRSISKAQAKALGAFFHVSLELFI